MPACQEMPLTWTAWLMLQKIDVAQMKWEDPCTIQPDILLAADVLYDPGKHSTLCLCCTQTPFRASGIAYMLLSMRARQSNGVVQFSIDLLCAADYDCWQIAGAVPALVQSLNSLVNPSSTTIQKDCIAYIATALRNRATLQLFLDHAAASGLGIQDMSVQAQQCCVQFQHHLVLEPQRSNIVLHKICKQQ